MSIEFEDTAVENVGEPSPLPSFASEPDEQLDDWGQFDGLLERVPRSRVELARIAGDPGPVGAPNRRWRRRSIVSLRNLPGVDRWVSLHRLAEPHAREGLRRARMASPEYQIRRCGGFVHRSVQRDPARPLSVHAYGFALDINPSQNRPKRVQRGHCPVPFGPEWRAWWPHGVTQEFVEAMESVGWTWGGVWGRSGCHLGVRASRVSFLDPMHFELIVRG